MRKKKKRRYLFGVFRDNDIAVRIYLSFMFVLAFALILTGQIFIHMYQKNYTHSYTDLLTKQGKKISKRITKFYANNNLSQYEKYSVYIDELEQADKTDVWIVSNWNMDQPLPSDFTNISVEDGTLNEEMIEVLEGAFGGKIAVNSNYDKTYGMLTLRLAVPIYEKKTHQIIGGVMMVSMIDKQSMGIREGKYLITMSAVFAVLISYILALVFARYLSRPIARIGKHISRLASGDYSKIGTRKKRGQLAALENKLDMLSGQLSRAEEERESLEQVRRDFFANISHELRTPLTVIRGYAETLTDGVITDQQGVEELYQRILAECQRMERLVKDLFVLSKMQNPDFEIEKEPVSLVQIFEDVVRSGRVLGQDKNIQIEVSLPEEDPCMMLGDYVRLQQMFMVILDNAIKFSNQNGKILIQLTKQEGKLKIRIQDYGVGIDEEELPFIFEKFYKSKMKQNEKGTGLGLMIARQIALRHGGDIHVESVKGQGSAFDFSFLELVSMEEFE